MKLISKDKLIQALRQCEQKDYDLKDLGRVLDYFGDDWFIRDGLWEKAGDGNPVEPGANYKVDR
ncbi:MAG: hypothetical protein CVU99_15965 [Firmicutes bacterium HGW-Firmicutes-4]|jgi:hypothetical protein|nr:MAG: hypothetical protein CVU99_15965 [Firmicutes bacterium HGW-Firmicutes-4]